MNAKTLLMGMNLDTTRYIAKFHPQEWVDDMAVPPAWVAGRPLGPDTWDVTDFLSRLPPAIRDRILQSIETGRVRDENDELIRDPAAPDWIREWGGPFDITVTQA